ncbi:MAG: proline dehydrogenase [Bacteroidetes bacterium]|jgi:proline dehydrogenase|nr:proline dehydrogenase [Bacteroidota bacterium]
MKLPFVLASRFVAAETLDETLPVVHDLHQQGLRVALDMLGEYVDDRAVALRARDAYIDVVHTLADVRTRTGEATNLSIKLSMMGQKIDEAFCLDNLRQLLDAAQEHDIFVRLDMEGSDITASTLSLFEAVYPDYPEHVGIVLQAYLKRTRRDIERMCELNASVRLCKGAYKEPPEIAYQNMDVIRERFIEYMELLLQHAHYPGIATHDDLLIDATKRFVAAHDVGRDDFEFQMLYGIRPETQVAIAEEGYNMLVYVPYGTEWLPYFTRRLRERKENVWFVLKNLFRR